MKTYLAFLAFTVVALTVGVGVLIANGIPVPIFGAFGVFIFVAVIFGIPTYLGERGVERAAASLDLNSPSVEIPVGYEDYQGLKAAMADLLPGQSIPETLYHRVVVSKDSVKFIHSLWAGSSELPTSLLEQVEAREGRLDLLFKDSHRIIFDGGFRRGESTEPYARRIRELVGLGE